MMTLYLIRHAKADLRGPAYPDDSLRPLIAKGHEQARALAAAFKVLDIGFDRLFSSPMLRAVQTAGPLAARLKPGRSLETLKSLSDNDYVQVLIDIAQALKSKDHSIALVGHEPYLSELTSLLLSDDTATVAVKFKKAAVVELFGPIQAGAMTLQGMLGPKVSKQIARARLN